MGKIADALERHKKEKTTRVEFLNDVRPRKSVTQEREISFAKEFCTLYECSPKIVVLSAPDSIDAENFKMLRSQIVFTGNNENTRAIMVTSALPGEGKTFVASNLAVSIALGINEHVLLVDCDMRRPNMHQMFGYSNSKGLHEYLTGKGALEDLIIQTKIDKLSFLPAGGLARNPSEILSSAKMRDFLQEVKNRYQDRYVILDATPSQLTAEARVLSQNVDGIILVVMAQRAPRDIIKSSLEHLRKDKIIGLVFNGYQRSFRHYKYYKNHIGTSPRPA